MHKSRGKRPISMFKVPPMSDAEKVHFIKMWKQCIPKMGTTFTDPPIIYGTGGQVEE